MQRERQGGRAEEREGGWGKGGKGRGLLALQLVVHISGDGPLFKRSARERTILREGGREGGWIATDVS